MFRNIPLNEMYSIVFYVTSGIYTIIGMNILSLNLRNSLNRIFLLVCLSLGIWAFSFSLLNSSITYEEAHLWNRISVLGWGILYSFLLHYFLVLTDRSYVLMKKRWLLLIYLPALINIYVFGVNNSSAQIEFVLSRTNAGWINLSENSFFDYFFYTYYLIYSLAGFICLWTWKKAYHEKIAKRTAIIVSVSFIAGIVLGTITDVMFRTMYQEVRPQLGVVYALIPVLSILYSTKKHGIMVKISEEVHIESKGILSYERRKIFYKILSFVAIAGSLVLFFSNYFVFESEITGLIKLTGFIYILGIIIWGLSNLNIKEENQDFILGWILASVIPAVYIYYSFHEYNSIVWTVPLFLMILTTVFRNRKLLYSVLISALFSEFFNMIAHSTTTTSIDRVVYLQRLATYILIAIIIYYINYLYRQRLDEHEAQTGLQKKISEISSDFIRANTSNFDERVNEMLKKSGEYFGADRAYLFRCSEDLSVAEYTNEWCNHLIDPMIDLIGAQPTSAFPWWMNELQENNKVYIHDVAKLPIEAESERELLTMQGVQSLISVPIFSHNKLLGFLGFDAVRHKKVWSTEHQEALQIMANIVSDTMVKVEAEKQINFMAYYDTLTGLSNRSYFNLQIDRMIEIAKQNEEMIGILFLDLDEFKSINDTLGHDSGDKLLIEVAKRLNLIVSKSDYVCRFGGDEFLIMLSHINDLSQIKSMTEKIMASFERPIEIKDQEFYITASCGVAVYPIDGKNSETLIKSADLAMYVSKDNGKNKYTFCTSLMKDAVKEKMELSNDLYKALEREEFVLYYQPQINIESRKIIGLEALIRWNHPERGMIMPNVFIPLAEQTGLINKIGEWVLNTACLQNKQWQLKGYSSLVMAVNLSVEQFRGNRLVDVVSNALTKSQLEAKYLELEITESIAIKEPTYIIGVLHKLKSLGVSISIDDFGTEYSSLSRLKELPIDRLKMAMEFVQGIDKGMKDEAIAVVIINLAKNLGVKVIAEGVEEEGQFAFLKKRVCDEVQGYYFYRPMPAHEFEKLLQEGLLD